MKFPFTEDYFEIINCESKAYWVGYLAADGCLLRGNGVYLSSKDIEVLDRFRSDLKVVKKMGKSEINGKDYFRICLYSNKMYNDLLKYNLTPRKSLTLKPPANLPKDMIRHWIRGYFDGDGCITIKAKKPNHLVSRCRFGILGTFEVLNFIKINLPFELREIRLKDNKSKIYSLSTGKIDNIYSVFNYLYSGTSLYLKRKKDKFIEYFEMRHRVGYNNERFVGYC